MKAPGLENWRSRRELDEARSGLWAVSERGFSRAGTSGRRSGRGAAGGARLKGMQPGGVAGRMPATAWGLGFSHSPLPILPRLICAERAPRFFTRFRTGLSFPGDPDPAGAKANPKPFGRERATGGAFRRASLCCGAEALRRGGALVPARPGENGEGLCAEAGVFRERGGREGRLKPSGAFEKSLLRPLPLPGGDRGALTPSSQLAGSAVASPAFPNELLRVFKGEKGKRARGLPVLLGSECPIATNASPPYSQTELRSPRKEWKTFLPCNGNILL